MPDLWMVELVAFAFSLTSTSNTAILTRCSAWISWLKFLAASLADFGWATHMIPITFARTVFGNAKSIMVFDLKFLSAMETGRGSIAACPSKMILSTVVRAKMCLARHYLEVFYSIIAAIAVDVMHNFTRFQRASKMLAHYVAMLGNVAVSICIWMIWELGIAVVSFIYDPVQIFGCIHSVLQRIVCLKYITHCTEMQGGYGFA